MKINHILLHGFSCIVSLILLATTINLHSFQFTSLLGYLCNNYSCLTSVLVATQ